VRNRLRWCRRCSSWLSKGGCIGVCCDCWHCSRHDHVIKLGCLTGVLIPQPQPPAAISPGCELRLDEQCWLVREASPACSCLALHICRAQRPIHLHQQHQVGVSTLTALPRACAAEPSDGRLAPLPLARAPSLSAPEAGARGMQNILSRARWGGVPAEAAATAAGTPGSLLDQVLGAACVLAAGSMWPERQAGSVQPLQSTWLHL
jgi:hypothetical protein